MPKLPGSKKQQGFTLLEALFAMVVLSIAMLSIARMHALVTQDGGYSKARGIAVNLAQEKVDDLRSFTSLNTGCATVGVFCYTEIGANTGGRQDDTTDALMIASGGITVGNTTYNRTWAVTDYYRCGTSAPSTTNCSSPYTKSYPDFKIVVVTVAWTDEQLTSRTVQLTETIHSSALTAEANALGAPYAGAGPRVSYRPVGVPDAVPVPVNVGGNQQKESSKPLPDVSTSGESKLVKFDVITYDTSSSTGDGTYQTKRREEFFTVNCVCKYAASNASRLTPTRLVWDGADLVAKPGRLRSKPTAIAHRSGPNADPDQPALCDACCANHHDSGESDDPKYDPDRPDSDYYSSGNAEDDHKHYWWTTVGTPSDGLTAVAGAANDVYLEACRFGRVDGIVYPWQDWRMVDITVFGYDFLTTGSNLATYQTYLINKVEHKFKTDGSITGTTDPGKPTGRNVPLYVGDSTQLLGRVVYLDRIYQASNPNTIDSTYYSAISTKKTNGQDWLLYVPFYEANLTLLIDWTSSNHSNVSVTMAKVNDIVDPVNGYYGTYSRGVVTGLTAGTTETITARALISNSGLTSGVYANTGTNCPVTAANCISYGIDTQDNTTTLTDTIQVSVNALGTTYGISGTIYKYAGSVNLSGITITASPSTGVTCSISGAGGDRTYSCLVPSGWSGTLTPSKTGYSYDPGSRTYSNVTAGITGQDYVMCSGGLCPP